SEPAARRSSGAGDGASPLGRSRAAARRGPADRARSGCDRREDQSRGDGGRDRALAGARGGGAGRGARAVDASGLRILDAEADGRGSKDGGACRGSRSLPGQEMTRQITDGSQINHPTYFLQSSFFPGDREMFFTSYRTGGAQLFEVSLETGDERQLTRGEPIHPYSAALHPDAETLVVTRGGALWAVKRATREERCIFAFAGAQLGECSITRDGEWLTAAFKCGAANGLAVGRFDGAGWNTIPFPRTVIHPQFHPLEFEWIEFSGDPAPRM